MRRGNPLGTGTQEESGTHTATGGYQVHANWNAGTKTWDRTADKSTSSVDSGHWSREGSGDFQDGIHSDMDGETSRRPLVTDEDWVVMPR